MNHYEKDILDCIDFDNLEIDEILDNRENEHFDKMWMTNYKAVDVLKGTRFSYEKSVEKFDEILEGVYKLVLSKTNSSDLDIFLMISA